MSPRESSDARLVHKESELAEKVMADIEDKGDVITPNKVASDVRYLKKSEIVPALESYVINSKSHQNLVRRYS